MPPKLKKEEIIMERYEEFQIEYIPNNSIKEAYEEYKKEERGEDNEE